MQAYGQNVLVASAWLSRRNLERSQTCRRAISKTVEGIRLIVYVRGSQFEVEASSRRYLAMYKSK
jgi:hypothetical protein